MEHQTQSLHYFQCYAALDRIDFRHLPNESPIGTVAELPISTFLPSLADCSALRQNYAILIGREVVKKLPYFQIFADCIPKHIHHEYSEAMGSKSVLVGILFMIEHNFIMPAWMVLLLLDDYYSFNAILGASMHLGATGCFTQQ